MTTYSITRLGAFRTCRYQYKLRYIERPDVPVPPTTIEAFMGSKVHEALEKLYADLQYQRTDPLEEVLAFYHRKWDADYTDDIIIVKADRTSEDYRAVGAKCISDYYASHAPFDQMRILGLETMDRLTLPNGAQFHVRMDKLARVGGDYYVCDYKTNGRMKTQSEADADEQLAMYSIWVRENYPDAERVHLLWHMLRFDTDVVSERTDAQLEALAAKIASEIDEAESCTEWPTRRSELCDYCQFKAICPEFAHEAEISEKDPEEFADDEGVMLVDELSRVKAEQKALSAREDEIKGRIVEFSESKGVTAVYGTYYKCNVKPSKIVKYPDDMSCIMDALKEAGRYEEYLQINKSRLTTDIKNGDANPRVVAMVTVSEGHTVSQLKKRKDLDEFDDDVSGGMKE